MQSPAELTAIDICALLLAGAVCYVAPAVARALRAYAEAEEASAQRERARARWEAERRERGFD